MITIDFRETDQAALLESDEADRGFAELRLELGLRTSGIVDETATRFAIPWWEFLPARNLVRAVAERHNLQVRLTNGAREQLKGAQARETELHAALASLPSAAPEVTRALTDRGFRRELLPYQLRNVARISRLAAAADFSIPGAGKTTEALAFFALRRRPESRLLVVSPKNAFSAWEEQLPLCLKDDAQFVRLTGGRERIDELLRSAPRFMLIGYRQLAEVIDIVSDFLRAHDCFLFVDESHHIKLGAQGVIGEAVLRLSHLPSGKLVMTGTPLPQSIADLIPQIRFLFPEVAVNEENVAQVVQPIFVRTTKKELKLPPVTRVVRRVQMSAGQDNLYRLAAFETARQAKGALSSHDRAILRSFNRSVIRLLQIASNPALLGATSGLSEEAVRAAIVDGESAKISYVCDRVRKLTADGRKVIVWSIFVRNVELLSTRLADLGADFIHGGVEAGSEAEEATREAKLKRFKEDPLARVLVANPAACSEGISLHTVCHNAIYLDRGFNAAQYIQSEERIHRIGLAPETKTTVEIVQSEGTIDEVVQARLAVKIDRMARVLGDDSLGIDDVLELDPEDESLDRDDIAELLEHLRARGRG